MKTPVVFGIVVALHCVALGTLMMTGGCGTSKGGSGGPVQFQDKPAVLPKPADKGFMPEKVAKPHPKPFVAVEEDDFEKPEFDKPEVVKPAPAVKPAKADKKDKPAAAATKSYTIKKGDSLGYIAQRFKISINEIKELNPTIKNPAKIREGQALKLPAYVNLNAPAPKRPSKPKPIVTPVDTAVAPVLGGTPAPIVSAGEYIVVNGDYPEKIAKKCGVKMDDLIKANKITDPKKLKIGQKLVVPGAAAVELPAMPLAPVEPSPIAPFSPTSPVPGVAPLAPLAPAVPGGIVEPAGELRPIAPGAPAAPATPVAPGLKPAAPLGAVAPAPALKNTVMQKHLVAPGETLKDIAMLYTVTVNDIMRVNGMTSDTVVPGQSLNIPPAQ